MVAIIGGNGLGVNAGALDVLGRFGIGQTGTAGLGQNGERSYVDVATGNLVIQDQDGLLAGVGPNAVDLRTYNSQGVSNFTNNDGWMNGQYKSVVNLGNGVLRRTDADGSTRDYAWNAGMQAYVESFSPGGASDTIKANSDGTYTWTSGSTGSMETYQGSGLGLITQAKDASGNTLTFSYTGNLLTGVQTADGETISYAYTGTNLTQMLVKGTAGQLLSQVSYTYDGSNRLITVAVALNPQGKAEVTSADALTSYVTTYTYDGTSNRVASITQSDGTTVSFSYTLVNGAYRVTSVTDGNGAVTTFGYNTAANTTTVTDALGVSTVYVYNANGQFTQVRTGVTAANSAGLAQANYAYNSLGDVTSVTDATGRTTLLTYDTRGNLTKQVDAGGDTQAWTYNSSNQVLTQTVYAAPAEGTLGTTIPQTTRYVYASGNATQLRFVIGADGSVKEYRYNAQGLRTSTIGYAGRYDVSGLTLTAVPTEAQMVTWGGTQALAQTQRTDDVYDFRGQLQTSTTYGSVDGTGNGISTTAAKTQYVYDQRGNLLQTISPDGRGITNAIYDGLGRVVSSVMQSSDGSVASATTVYQYDDAHGKTSLTLASGLKTTSTYDKAGRLVSVMQLSGSTVLGTTSYVYDKDGRLLMTTDASRARAWSLYDAMGQKVASIDGAGGLTEYVHDAAGRVTETIQYATAIDPSILVDGSGNPKTAYGAGLSLGALRPAAASGDVKSWSLYDGAGRLAWQVDGAGDVTETKYDGASRVVSVTKLATPIDTWRLKNGIGVALYAGQPVTNLLVQGENAFDRWTNYTSGTGSAAAVVANNAVAPDGSLTADTVTFNAGSGTTSSDYSLIASASAPLIPGTQYTSTLWVKGAAGQQLLMRGVAGSGYQLITCTGSWQQVSVKEAASASSYHEISIGIRQGMNGTLNSAATVQMWGGRIEENQAYAGPSVLTNPESDFTSWSTTISGAGVAPAVTANAGAAPDGTQTADTVSFSVGSGTTTADYSLLYSNFSGLAPGALYSGSIWVKGTAGQQLIMRGAAGSGYQLITLTGAWQHIVATEAVGVSGAGNLQIGLRQGVISGTTLNTSVSVQLWRGEMRPASDGGQGTTTFVASPRTTSDRTTTMMYSDEGLLRATVDGEGYLMEYRYDGMGQKVQALQYQAVRYQTATSLGTLAASVRSLKPGDALVATADPDAIQTFTYYNDRGQVIGEVDGEGYLTEHVYNAAGQVVQQIRYANRTKVAATASSALSDLRNPDATRDQVTTTTYDALGRMQTQTNPEGTITQYAYDIVGHVISTTTALNTSDQRVGRVQYDVQGRVTAELSGVGAALLTGDATHDSGIWAQYATKYAYDAVGRKASETDALGHRTVYFYDDAGRLTHTVNAEGEVSEAEYDALGRVSATVQYANRIEGAASVGLTGGLLSATANQPAASLLQHAKFGSTSTTFEGNGAVRVWHKEGTNSSIGTGVGSFKAGEVVTLQVRFKAALGTTGQIYLGSSTATADRKYAYLAGNGDWQTISVTMTLTADGSLTALLYGNRDNTKDNSQSVIYDDVLVTSSTRGVVFQDGFENGHTGWSASGFADDVTASTASTYSGNDAARVWHKQGTGSAISKALGSFTAGEVVTLQVKFKAPVGTTGQVFLGNPGNTADTKTVYLAGNGDWQTISVTMQATTNEPLYAYLYGNLGNTTDNSQSVIYDDVVVTSSTRGVVFQDGFENGLAGWSPAGQQTDLLTPSTDTTFSGGGAARVWHQQGTNSSISKVVGSFTTGEVVTLQARFKAPVGVTGQIYLGNGASLTDKKTVYLAGNGGWQTISVTVPVTANESLYAYLYGNRDYTTDNGQSVIYDDVVVTSSTRGVVFQDGFENGYAGWGVSGLADAVQDPTVGSPSNRRISYAYNASGRIWQTTDANGGVTQTTFDAFGEAVKVSKTLSLTQSLIIANAFDHRGLLTSTVSDQGGQNVTMQKTYDAFGRVTDVKDGDLNTTHMTYDHLGRMVTVMEPGLAPRRTSYDAFGRVFTETDARGYTTTYTYSDANRSLTVTTAEGVSVTTVHTRQGQTLSVKDGNGSVTSYAYDADGNLTGTQQTVSGVVRTAGSVYDALDRMVQSTDRNGNVVTYAYDLVNRLLVRTVVVPGGTNQVTKYEYTAKGQTWRVTDPNGVVTETAYDAKGQVLTQTVDPSGLGIQAVYSYDQAGNVLSVTTGKAAASAGVTTHYVYDDLGRRTYSVDGEGGVTKVAYDANGNVVDRIAYATKLTAGQWTPGAGNPAPAVDQVHDQEVRTVYDADNRAIYTLSSTGDGSQVSVVAMSYDANGNMTSRTAYANPIAAPAAGATAAQLAAAAATASKTPSPSDALIRRVYDKDNRLIWSMNGAGAVTHQQFDADGRLVKVVAYAQTLSATADPSSVKETPGSDRVTLMAYDEAGRLRFTVDALGGVTETVYDGLGNAVKRTAYAQAAAVPTTSSALLNASTFVPATNPNDRVTRAVYDAAGRQVFSIDASGVVVKSVYDGDGRVVGTTAYATPLTAAALAAIPTVAVPGNVAPQASTDDRTTVMAYDAAGRQIYKVDPKGYVTENTYDGSGRVTRTVLYANPVTGVGIGASVDAIKTKLPLNPNPAVDEVTSFGYDGAGNLTSTKDALGNAESYSYDGAGNKRSFTNKNLDTWYYNYDAAGRMNQETTPQVAVATSTLNATTGLVTASSVTQVLVTRMAYDALGNLTSRTEAYGTSSARTTSYQYDALGHQVLTTYPTVGVYNSATDLANLATDGATNAARAETVKTLSTQVSYDAFGDAVVNIDVSGNASSKVYDQMGRVAYDVDAMGFVTEYDRNVFGEVTTLTRYGTATSLNATASQGASGAPTLAKVAGVKTSAFLGDARSIKTTYDMMGRTVRVEQPLASVNDGLGGLNYNQAPVTKTSYNAFGEVFQTSILAKAPNGETGTGAVWAVTTNYYDQRGQVVATIDPMGYVTQQVYYAAGNLKTHTEYGKATVVPAGTVTSLSGVTMPGTDPTDRTVQYAYDLMNRKTTETQVGVTYSTASDGTSVTGNLVTASYGYDHVGNQTSATDGKGNTTLTNYDALGRITSVQSPTQGVGIAPVTTFQRDAFGNIVVQRQGAFQAGAGAPGSGSGPYDSFERTTATLYDAMGHAIAVTDPTNVTHFMSYDAAGHLAKTWQVVKDFKGVASTLYTAFTYDALGRQTGVITPATTNASNGTPTVDTSGRVSAITTLGQAQVGSQVAGTRYNGYGEVTGQGVYAQNATPQYQQTFEYDSAGRMWRTKGKDGNITVYLDDLQGHQTVTITSTGSLDLASYAPSIASEATIAALDPATGGVRRTDSQLDLLGRTLTETLPSRAFVTSTTSNVRPQVTQTFDRWGNVLSQTSVQNNLSATTSYTYNFRNQVTSQVQPNASGVANASDANCPVTQTYYDAVGNQVAVRDARGFVNGQVWDANGHLVLELHADGGVVNHAYDEFGEQVKLTDADGNVTQYGYDGLGRNTTITHVGVTIYTTSTDGKSTTPTTTPQTLTTTMVYDEAGRKLAEKDNAGNVTTAYTYDLRGNVIAKTDALNRVTTSAFDQHDRQIVSVDPRGSVTTWTYGPTGQLTGHGWTYVVDTRVVTGYEYSYDDVLGRTIRIPIYSDQYSLSSSTDAFVYDHAQQLTSQTTALSDGTHLARTYGYDAAGQMTSIQDVTTSSAGAVTDTKTTTYAYTLAGQHSNETTVENGNTTQNQTLIWDTLGRMVEVSAMDGVDIKYAYDKVGNKLSEFIERKQTTTQIVFNPKTETETTRTIVNDMKQNLFFGYDAMNRQILVDGAKALDPTITNSNQITNDYLLTTGGVSLSTTVNGGTPTITTSTAPQGHILSYDANGNRVSDRTYGTQVVQYYAVTYSGTSPLKTFKNGYIDWTDPDVQTVTVSTTPSYTTKTGFGTTFYKYDVMNRLSQVLIGAYDGYTSTANLLSETYAQVLDQRGYDLESRMVQQGPDPNKPLPSGYLNLVGSNTDASGVTSTVNKYDAAGELLSQHVINQKDSTQNYDASFSYDVAGNLTSNSVVQGSVNLWYATALTEVYEGYHDTSVSETITANGSSSYGTVTKAYDETGALIGVTNSSDSTKSQTLLNDASGHILQRTQNAVVAKEVVANGEVIARYGQTYSATDANWNFDLGFTPVTNSYPAAATGNYPVQSGDTLESIAQAAYGDSSLWYVVAQANGLSGDQDLRVGEVLTLPNRLDGTHNNAQTHTPYDPSKLIGNTNPNLPVPPPPPADNGGGCGGLGMIIMIAVAVVVTVYTAGAASAWVAGALESSMGAAEAGAIGAVVGGAIGGAAGSVVSQGVGIAIGAQNGFDWNQVGMGALSGAVGGAISGVNFEGTQIGGISHGTWLGGSTTGAVMTRAALTSAVTQGVAVATGLQDKFSWSSVAGAAVGAGVGKAANVGLGKAMGSSWGDFEPLHGITLATASGFAAGISTSLAHGGRVDVTQVATDAFGNALGSSLADSMKPDTTVDAATKAEAQKKILEAKLTVANKDMDILDTRVQNTISALDGIDAALKDPTKMDALKAAGIDPNQIGKLREAYKADLISSDVYFNNNYDASDPAQAVEALKASRMKDVLDQFGVHRMTQADIDAAGLKLDSSNWDDNGPGKSGYFGALYIEKHDGQEDQYYFANRGTEFDKGLSKAWRDGVADVANAEGYLDPQYQKAVQIGYDVSKALGAIGGTLTFTGHSLGGGLAAAQALATNGRALTFNAAAVGDRVAEKLKIDLKTSTANIDAYYLKGELVSWLQDSKGWDIANVALTPVRWAKGAVDMVRGLFGADVDLNLGIHGIPEANGTRIQMNPIFKNSDNPIFANDRQYDNMGFLGMDLMARATLHFNDSVQASFEHRVASVFDVLKSQPVGVH